MKGTTYYPVVLSDGKIVKVDLEDREKVRYRSWRSNGRGYAVSRPWDKKERRYRTLYMHRMIIGAEDGEVVDHINGDKLDNRKQNLRRVTQSENLQNAKLSSANRSGFRGVSWCRWTSRWVAAIWRHGKKRNLGRYEEIEDAARAYDAAALKFFGESAKTNESMGLLEGK